MHMQNYYTRLGKKSHWNKNANHGLSWGKKDMQEKEVGDLGIK